MAHKNLNNTLVITNCTQKMSINNNFVFNNNMCILHFILLFLQSYNSVYKKEIDVKTCINKKDFTC